MTKNLLTPIKTKDSGIKNLKLTTQNSLPLKNYRTINVLGVKVDFISPEIALPLIGKWVETNKQYQITTPNPEHIVISLNDYRFKDIINHSALAIADGVGLVWAAKTISGKSDEILLSLSESNSRKDLLLGTKGCGARIVKAHKIHQPSQKNNTHKNCISFNAKSNSCNPVARLTGIDLMLSLCQMSYKKNWKVFLLGGQGNSACKTVEFLQKHHTSQTLTKPTKSDLDMGKMACLSGAKEIKKETIEERRETIEKINNFKPDFLFVAYGAPYQEKWIADNLAKLKVKIAMGVGGAFDYLSQNVQRAPVWMRNMGLEWLYRLLKEPWRVLRQLRLAKFAWLVLREKWLNG